MNIECDSPKSRYAMSLNKATEHFFLTEASVDLTAEHLGAPMIATLINELCDDFDITPDDLIQSIEDCLNESDAWDDELERLS